MARKATKKQVLGVVERFVGSESAIYTTCVRMFDEGRHPNEVMMWVQANLRASSRPGYVLHEPPC